MIIRAWTWKPGTKLGHDLQEVEYHDYGHPSENMNFIMNKKLLISIETVEE